MTAKTQKRGRKSTAEKALSVIEGRQQKPPESPADLTADELDIWNAVLKTEPIGYFETAALQSLLADYCRHRATSAMITEQIRQFDPEWLKMEEGSKHLDRLTKMRDRELRAVMSIATKLRITNQARYTPQAAATKQRNRTNKVAKPWET